MTFAGQDVVEDAAQRADLGRLGCVAGERLSELPELLAQGGVATAGLSDLTEQLLKGDGVLLRLCAAAGDSGRSAKFRRM